MGVLKVFCTTTTSTVLLIQNAEQPQDAENSALSEDQWRPAPWTGREGQVGFYPHYFIIIPLNKPHWFKSFSVISVFFFLLVFFW